MPTFKSASKLLASVVAISAATLLPSAARASQEFPGGIQEAAGMPCAPSCKLCHGVPIGSAANFQNKVLGKTLFMINGLLLPHDVPALKAAYAKYASDPANAAAVAALKEGMDPETGEGLCGPTYGCGAHLAKKAPPADLAAPLWVIGAVVAGGLLRRRKSSTN